MSAPAVKTSTPLPPDASPVFLTAEWRHLVMLNYEVDAALLAPHVPRGTELDLWDGKAFLSVVGFLFLNTRVLGVAIPFHTDFEEVNLRFYVRRRAEEGWRQGVCFLRELVPRHAVTLVANTLYNENYRTLPMRHDIALNEEGGHAEYSWRFGKRWHRLSVTTEGQWRQIASSSHEEFIAEHYWGYAARKDGGIEYQVAHPRWCIRAAREAVFDCDVAALYGSEYARALSGAPASAFVADGSFVAVHRGVRF